jgi:hypothetical protein
VVGTCGVGGAREVGVASRISLSFIIIIIIIIDMQLQNSGGLTYQGSSALFNCNCKCFQMPFRRRGWVFR